MTNRFRTLAAVLGLLALAACSGSPKRVKGAPPPVMAVTPGEIDAVFVLLMAGEEKAAGKQLKALLKRDPMSPNARLLDDSIARDPKDLLGPQSYPYTVRAGDTPAGVAQRLLGNRLKAFQLLRYNGLVSPVVLTAGQVLRIPGEPPRVEPVRRPEPAAPRPAPSAPAAKPKPSAARTVVAPPVAAANPAANPVAARSSRAAGLAALNGGDVNRAVGLLRRAASLDPGNPAIARDLARAQRIAATVRARR